MRVTAAHLLFMLRPLGLVPRLKAFRMPLSSSVGCRGPAWSRALMAGGSSRFSAASVAGRPRQNVTSSGSPATEAITAILAAVLHARMPFETQKQPVFKIGSAAPAHSGAKVNIPCCSFALLQLLRKPICT